MISQLKNRNENVKSEARAKTIVGLWLPVGIALGVAVGLSIGSLTVGIPTGMAAGLMMGLVTDRIFF